jgi:hypothetical protein
MMIYAYPGCRVPDTMPAPENTVKYAQGAQKKKKKMMD